jgi:hypothetical protein
MGLAEGPCLLLCPDGLADELVNKFQLHACPDGPMLCSDGPYGPYRNFRFSIPHARVRKGWVLNRE